jgi:hypothetical protein
MWNAWGIIVSTCNVLVGNLKARDHFAGLDVKSRIILKWILKKQE